MGKAEAALDDFERALRLSPFDPMRFNAYADMGFAHFVAGRDEEAIAHVERALLERPDIVWIHRMLAACASMIGDQTKAEQSVAIVEEYAPGFGVKGILSALPHGSDEMRERFRAALLKAGFKP
jgi:adenylate cyclase